MLKPVLFFLLFLSAAGIVSGQANTSVQAANCVVSGTTSEAIALDDSPLCLNGSVKLYYQFIADQLPGGSVNLGSSWTVSSGTFTYLLYGPYPDLATAHADVASGLAVDNGSSVSASSSQTIALGSSVQSGDVYIVELTLSDCSTTLSINSVSTRLTTCEPTDVVCEDCLGKFQPGPGKYVLSGWTKEKDAAVTKTSYDLPSIVVAVDDDSDPPAWTFTPSGEIIDGWQQITGVFEIDGDLTSLEISLEVGGSGETAWFDDIRIFPFDGSMMTYVYDPVTLRLVAELDERNYAKLYEYDEEGKLVRVKKETEKGVMTITESRENTVKRP